MGRCGVVTCGRRPIEKMPMKNPRRISPRGLFEDCCDNDAMPVICPTCQILFDMSSVRSSCASTQAVEWAVRGGSPDRPRRLSQLSADLCSLSLGWSSCCALRRVEPAATLRTAAVPRSARSMVLPNIRRMLPRRRRRDPEQRLPTRRRAQHRRHAPLPWPGMKSETPRSGSPPSASSSRFPRICRDRYRIPEMRHQRGVRHHILARFGRVPD